MQRKRIEICASFSCCPSDYQRTEEIANIGIGNQKLHKLVAKQK